MAGRSVSKTFCGSLDLVRGDARDFDVERDCPPEISGIHQRGKLGHFPAHVLHA